MSEIYVASLWLTCESADAAVLRAFSLRFDRSDECSLDILAFPAPVIAPGDPDPGPWNDLNQKLTTYFLPKAIAAQELTQGTVALTAFDDPAGAATGYWVPGKGGTHAGSMGISGYDSAGTAEPWFVLRKGRVWASCWWKRVTL